MSVRENKLFDAFQSNVPCAYLLKTSENLWFSDGFRGYTNGRLTLNGLRNKKYKEKLHFKMLWKIATQENLLNSQENIMMESFL